MIGLEQTVVPLISVEEFDIQSDALIVYFIVSFGLVKAILNLFAGKISMANFDPAVSVGLLLTKYITKKLPGLYLWA